MDRRNFIKTITAAGTIAVIPSSLNIFTPAKKKYISDRVMLGKTGVEVSRLAIGTGTKGWAGNSNQTRELGIKGLSSLLQRGFDKGVTFWDSADQYGTHPHLKEALKYVPREKIAILTKTHASTADEMKADLDRFRKELGTDYIDVLLLHLMRAENWPEIKAGAMDVISKARQDGIVRAHGVSCHTLGALKTAANTDWVQIDLARINQAGIIMDDSVSVVTGILKNMKAKGKSVMGMKILGDGKLSDRVDESLRFVLSQDYVDCFTIGIENLSQLEDLEKRLPEASLLA